MRLRRQRERLSRLMRHLRHLGSDMLPVTVHARHVTLLADGPSFFDALFHDLATARHVICLEFYRIRADRTGSQFADLLLAAVERGVAVYLIYDAIGCRVAPDSYFQRLREGGVTCLAFNPLSIRRGVHWFDRRDHRKMVLVDGKTAYLGGINIGDAYAGLTDEEARFRDVGFSLDGDAVSVLQDLFCDTWQMESGNRLMLPEISVPVEHTGGEILVTFISGGPNQRRSAIRTAFRVAMASAAKELLIANPYFIPGPRILRSLLRAARRGVRVRLLLPARNDVPIVRVASRSYYEVLLKAGIEIYELERQLLHAKLMLIDRERAVIGSANLDQRSFHRNFEINAIIRCSGFGRQIRDLLQRDITGSKRITLEDHGRRGVTTKVLELLLRPISWFL